MPSMMSLRAFEAAARHLSFTRAAIELNLTQTAISHQIKNLEDLLQVKLFVRSANMIALTEVGETYLRSVRAAILEISAATDRATDQSDENILTVQCLGLFAIKRLLPHLHDFRAQHPSIALKLRTIQIFENNFHHDFDVAIWHGAGDWMGMTSEKLAEEEVFPVCSPRILAEGLPIKMPEDLQIGLAREALSRAVAMIAEQAEALADEIERGSLTDRGGPNALRLFAAVVRIDGADELAPAGHA